MSTLTPSSMSPLNKTAFEGAAMTKDEVALQASASLNGGRVSFPATALYSDSLRFAVKRVVDRTGALVGLFLLAPVMVFIAVLIGIDSPGPVLFRQLRRGFRDRPFRVLKFRTMSTDAEIKLVDLENSNECSCGVLFKIRDDPRVTRLGRFLRRTSLDELPQLINVLWGEMSLVGPRPLQLRDSERLLASDPEAYYQRLQVMPGVTGPWQVGGRSELDCNRMVELDVDYAKNWTLGQDMLILMKTVSVVLFRKGAY
jgi:lipopolysaccharide/colanic/teichoic acid biosynthesis glycosyltransferase